MASRPQNAALSIGDCGYDGVAGPGRAAPRPARDRPPWGSKRGKGPVAQKHDPPGDQKIIDAVLAGDSDAFESLVERHKDHVGRIVAGKVPRQDAPEVMHEVFIKAFVSLPGYRPIKPFAHWLAILAVRACHDYWRGRYRRRDLPMSALAPEPGGGPERRAEAAMAGLAPDRIREYESWQLLDWALGHLSPADRMAVTLVHLEGWSLAEAAEALGWSPTVVKLRNFRARKRLRSIISQSLSSEVSHDPPEQ